MFLRKKSTLTQDHPLTIHENKHIRDFLKHCTHNSFVILDLDNTVMESKQELGSDQWFVKLMEHACNILPDKAEAAQLVIFIYHTVQHHAKMKAVEAKTVHIIKALQDINIPVIAVTARGAEIIAPTLEQLHEIGIRFSRQWGKAHMELDIGKTNTQPIYRDGIIFCSGNDKGKAIESFFNKIQLYPHHVVMVDDKEKHLKCVHSALKKIGAHFIGIRYSHLDEKVSTFEMQKASTQLTSMMHLFSQKEQMAIEKLDINKSSILEYKKI